MIVGRNGLKAFMRTRAGNLPLSILFFNFFHRHDTPNIYTFTETQFKVRPHLMGLVLDIIEFSTRPTFPSKESGNLGIKDKDLYIN